MDTPLLANYIHNLDPFAIQFTESFGIRWYGLAYVAGFAAAYFLIRWFVKLRACELKSSEVADYITLSALAGVMLGGRLGYLVLYNSREFFANPLIFFDFLGGGMSSHGGIFGLAVFTFFYARFKKISWLGLGDNLVTVAPLGVFFGRLANFVNGELYGRPTQHSFAMKFPDELHEIDKGFWKYSNQQLQAFTESISSIAPELKVNVTNLINSAKEQGFDPHRRIVESIIEVSNENDEVRQMLGELLTPRHPSQLYEALFEGLLLFLVLLAIRLKWRNLYHGIISGLFFILYAAGRIFCEAFREPDASEIAGMTRGQFYSLFMFLIGAAFIAWGLIRKRTNQLREEAA